MFSLLDKSNFLIFFLLFPFSFVEANNNEFKATGSSSFFGGDISENECYKKAKKEAEKQIMSNAGLEVLRFIDEDICVEINQKSSCSLFKDSQVYYEGGFISKKILTKKPIEGEGVNKTCSVFIEATVTKYQSQPDPNFIFTATLGHRKKRVDEEFFIQGETNLPSYIYLLGWLEDKDEYQKLIPNEFEKLEKISGKFQIPSPQGLLNYGLIAKFPINIKKDIVEEYLVIVASKEKLELIDKESKDGFHRRLYEYGRENWKMIRLGYVIIKE